MDRKSYTVTERAGAFVAGMRSPGAGKTMLLTEEQAVHALQLRELEAAFPESEATPGAADEKPQRMRRLPPPGTAAAPAPEAGE